MSLEQALAENTAAINKLIALVEKNNAPINIPAERVTSPAAGQVTSPAAETAKAETAKAETAKAETAKAEAPKELTYQDIRAPFLKLVEANEKVALGILSDLGIKSLKAIEGQADKYADVLARIQKAQG